MLFSPSENPVGLYIFESKISKAKTLRMELKIKKKGYELNSKSDFKGNFSEYGSWELKGDTLILTGKTRKDKYDKNNSYNTNMRKQEYEYTKKMRFILLENQLCDLNTNNRGKGYCYIRK